MANEDNQGDCYDGWDTELLSDFVKQSGMVDMKDEDQEKDDE